MQSALQMETMQRVFDAVQRSHACHTRNISILMKELQGFEHKKIAALLLNVVRPALVVKPTERPAKLVLQFVVALFANLAKGDKDKFLEIFVAFIGPFLDFTASPDKFVRIQAAHLVSEMMQVVPKDAELPEQTFQLIKSAMNKRLLDKIAEVRAWAARALQRLVVYDEDGNVSDDASMETFKMLLTHDSSSEVRQAVLLSLPESRFSIPLFVHQAADTNQGVRHAAFSLLCDKFFPLESFSIKQRVELLSHGLREPASSSVKAACLRLLQQVWVRRDCGDDIIKFLEYLDVEEHADVARQAVTALLDQGHVPDATHGLREFIGKESKVADAAAGEVQSSDDTSAFLLLSPEQALYWRTVCLHYHSKAQSHGGEAARRLGMQGAIAAEAADDANEQLEGLLPATAAQLVGLMEAHVDAGVQHRFSATQLLGLADVLDIADVSARLASSRLLSKLLCPPSPASVSLSVSDALDKTELEIKLLSLSLGGSGSSGGGGSSGSGDGSSDEWAAAVWGFAQHVVQGEELVRTVAEAAAAAAGPCREGRGKVWQWAHCLALVRMMLDALGGSRKWAGIAMEPQEVLNCLLLPGLDHPAAIIRRAAVHCLGLYCHLSLVYAQQNLPRLLQLCQEEASSVQSMAVKVIFDLILWHGLKPLHAADVADADVVATSATGKKKSLTPGGTIEILGRILNAFDAEENGEAKAELAGWGGDEAEGAASVAAEGFAKMLIWQSGFDEQRKVFRWLLEAFFGDHADCCPRLKQVLSEFFRIYSTLQPTKDMVAAMFLPSLKRAWHPASSSSSSRAAVAARQKAAESARFLLWMLLNPPMGAQQANQSRKNANEAAAAAAGEEVPAFDADEATQTAVSTADQSELGFEQLAIQLAVEVSRMPSRKSAADKALASLLCKSLMALPFRRKQQRDIKCMRSLLPLVADVMQDDKTISKDLRRMEGHLKAMDETPSEELPLEAIEELLAAAEEVAAEEEGREDWESEERRGGAANTEDETQEAAKFGSKAAVMNQSKQGPSGRRSGKKASSRKVAKKATSDEDSSESHSAADEADMSSSPLPPTPAFARPTRASKAAASNRIRSQLGPELTDVASSRSDSDSGEESETDGEREEVGGGEEARDGEDREESDRGEDLGGGEDGTQEGGQEEEEEALQTVRAKKGRGGGGAPGRNGRRRQNAAVVDSEGSEADGEGGGNSRRNQGGARATRGRRQRRVVESEDESEEGEVDVEEKDSRTGFVVERKAEEDDGENKERDAEGAEEEEPYNSANESDVFASAANSLLSMDGTSIERERRENKSKGSKGSSQSVSKRGRIRMKVVASRSSRQVASSGSSDEGESVMVTAKVKRPGRARPRMVVLEDDDLSEDEMVSMDVVGGSDDNADEEDEEFDTEEELSSKGTKNKQDTRGLLSKAGSQGGKSKKSLRKPLGASNHI